jgi:hypothetical protein
VDRRPERDETGLAWGTRVPRMGLPVVGGFAVPSPSLAVVPGDTDLSAGNLADLVGAAEQDPRARPQKLQDPATDWCPIRIGTWGQSLWFDR